MLDSVLRRTAPPGEFESLHQAARESACLARSLAATTEQLRALPAELVEKLTKAELLRSGVPRHLGGPQALERRFRDAHTATAHFQVNQASYELPGRLLLGQPAQTGQL